MSEVKLTRMNGKILEPIPAHAWESRAAFNPGAVRVDDEVHMLYRGVEGENLSTIGYARLNRAGEVLYRHPEPVIRREWPQEKQGAEDPRIVPYRGRYLVFYTGFNGQTVRVIVAGTADFKRFEKLGIVGPDYNDKDAMIFPEDIGGKIAFLHRIEPNIQLAYFDSFEHFLNPEPDYWPEHLKYIDRHTVMYHEYSWEAEKIGAGPPPIRTDAGWLLIYHGVDKNLTYRAGAALLDEKDPGRVIARLPYPILEPERDYERIGDVNMVVFPEGAVVFEDELQVYYGGADKVVGLATCKLSDLIEALWKHRIS